MPTDEHEKPFFFPDNSDLSTRSVDERKDAPLAQPRSPGPLDAGLAAPWVVDLHLDSTTLSFRLEAEQRLLLGRADGNIKPDLDLTPFNGMDRGVSRRHAVLVANGDRLEIVDLSSTNGTFINGQRLAPFKPYRLRQGDELHLGEIRMVLTLDLMPVHLSPRWHQPWVRRRSITSVAGHGRRVLIVEPSLETGSTLKAILEGLDYNVQVVNTFADAFYAITLRLPDALVLTLGGVSTP
ncbi:MAG: FHA domain-containing protein, partial [Anaerolineae bacterium]|nr:FHA domain-containing protein [Anaerolineae bacterium]